MSFSPESVLLPPSIPPSVPPSFPPSFAPSFAASIPPSFLIDLTPISGDMLRYLLMAVLCPVDQSLFTQSKNKYPQ